MDLTIKHQYVDRAKGEVRDEHFFGDRSVSLLYSTAREKAPFIFRLLTSARSSRLLSAINYDIPMGAGAAKFLEKCGADLQECVLNPEELDTPRKMFERKIPLLGISAYA